MFGRVLIPLDEEEVLVIPRAAVRRVGQLDIVDVAESGGASGATLRRRVVQLGRDFDDQVQVLSGLRVGEMVALPLKT
jgi:multidrug efflux pump subunit AcrA (membrane-fusion protein)